MKRFCVTVVLVALAVSLPAQSDQWEFRFGPRFWGAVFAGRYMLEPPAVDDVETSITGLISPAYERVGYYRAADGSLFTVPEDGSDRTVTGFNRFDLVWQLGIQQGILPRDDVTADAAVAFLLYRGQYDLPFRDDEQLFFASGLPETGGSLRGSVVGGLAYSRILTDDVTRLRRGFTAELALEWGPAFLHNQLLGHADYNRSTLSARGYLPLYEAEPAGGRNVFSAYLAGSAVVDWASGPHIPQIIRATTGGRSVRSATGGSVRGYGSGRFDATLKAIVNAEVRMNLPAVVIPQIVPGLVVYTDGGYFLDAEATSPTVAENNGVLISSGAGFFLDLFDAAQLVFYTNYLWTQTDVEGGRWVPFSLGFGFHY
jgi:hypothetical protein